MEGTAMAGQANGDTPEALFDFFMSCNAMQDILELFDRLKASLGLTGRTRLELFRGFKENLRSWKCSSLWAELDKRANQKVSWDTPTSNGSLCYLTPVLVSAACVVWLQAAAVRVECVRGRWWRYPHVSLHSRTRVGWLRRAPLCW